MWQELLVTLGLVLVIEGIMPFLSPTSFREVMLKIAQTEDSTLRYLGLISMLLGVALMYWAR